MSSNAAFKARLNACRRQTITFVLQHSKDTIPELKVEEKKHGAGAVSEDFDVILNEIKENKSDLPELIISKTNSLNNTVWKEYRSKAWENSAPLKEILIFTHLLLACTLLGNNQVVESFEHIDSAIILGGYLPPIRSIISLVEKPAKEIFHQKICSTQKNDIVLKYSGPPESTYPKSFSEQRQVEKIQGEISAQFFSEHVSSSTCFVIVGESVAKEKWSAYEKWADVSHLIETLGFRFVPSELGVHGEKKWREKIIQMETFINEHICNSHKYTAKGESTPNETVGYIAQHQIFDHFPILKDDFSFPSFLVESFGEPKLLNGWFGTAGTVTPLHTDTYENILAQVVGYKYLRLYSRTETPKLYAKGNISSVQCEREDFDLHPLAQSAEYTEVILGPGDMLYIPCHTWHYVRSLTPSFSINFWW